MYQTPAPLAAYLRRATFGLSPERREEVWNELEEHVLCRAEQLEFQGLPQGEALATALRELGPPLRVSAAMNGVHNMPKLIAFATLTTLAVSAGLYALAQQTPPTLEVPIQTKAPQMRCVKPIDVQPQLPALLKTEKVNCYQDDTRTMEGVFMSLSEIRKYTQSLGLKVEEDRQTSEINFFYGPTSEKVAIFYPVFKRGNESYLDAGDLLSSIMSGFPIPVTIHSAENPVFKIGSLGQWSLRSANGDATKYIYNELNQRAAYSLFDFSKLSKRWAIKLGEAASEIPERIIQTEFKAGEVVTAYHWKSSEPKTSHIGETYDMYTLVISQGIVNTQGRVALRIPTDAVFTKTEPNKPDDKVLLLKLTNTPLANLKSGIFLPKE